MTRTSRMSTTKRKIPRILSPIVPVLEYSSRQQGLCGLLKCECTSSEAVQREQRSSCPSVLFSLVSGERSIPSYPTYVQVVISGLDPSCQFRSDLVRRQFISGQNFFVTDFFYQAWFSDLSYRFLSSEASSFSSGSDDFFAMLWIEMSCCIRI